MTIILNTTDSFDRALRFALPGDTIRLSPGRHVTAGAWVLLPAVYNPVRIVADDPSYGRPILALEGATPNVLAMFRMVPMHPSVLLVGVDALREGITFDDGSRPAEKPTFGVLEAKV